MELKIAIMFAWYIFYNLFYYIVVGCYNLTFFTSWRMPSSGMLRHVALVRPDVSEECSASIIRVTRISKLETLALTSTWSTMWKNTMYSISLQGASVRFLSPWWWSWYVPLKHQFLQESHDITSQKTAFIIVSAVKTSNLT
jgi:hypothetical protein